MGVKVGGAMARPLGDLAYTSQKAGVQQMVGQCWQRSRMMGVKLGGWGGRRGGARLHCLRRQARSKC